MWPYLVWDFPSPGILNTSSRNGIRTHTVPGNVSQCNPLIVFTCPTGMPKGGVQA